MKKIVLGWLLLLVVVVIVGYVFGISVKAENKSVSTYDELMTALSYARDGETIEITDHIIIRVQVTMGYSDKQVTLKRTNQRGYIEFYYSGSIIQNLIFDGDDIFADRSFIEIGDGIIINNCIFQNCQTGGNGAAVSVWGGTAEFNSCVFKNNTANDGGSVAMISDNSILFNKCSFENNMAIENGGAVCIRNTESTLTFTECTLIQNSAANGGAIYSPSQVILDNSLIYGNKPNDLYIEHTGQLLVKSTLDDLKDLYEANNLTLQGVFDDSDAELDISSILTGEKGIVFRWEEVKESESTEEVESTPTPSPGTNTGNTSTDTQPINNYNYNPTIYNNVAASDTEKETDASPTSETSESAPIQGTDTSATIESGSDTKTYTATDDQSGNSTLEVRDGANTITININVGTAETNGSGVDAPISAADISYTDQVNEPMAAGSSSEKVETIYMDKAVNWVDVIELLVICSMAVYLFKDKLKVNFQGSNKKKE